MDNRTLHVIRTTVFGTTAAGGNPCPIVFEADQLSSAQMQRLAAGFGVETVFVLKPTRTGCDLRLRYFVPKHEMEMCGHATVATVSVLAEHGRFHDSPVRVETPLGALCAHWQHDPEGTLVTVEQFRPTFNHESPSVAEVSAALGVSEDAVALDIAPIQSVSVSRSKLIIPLRERGALDSLRPDFERLWALCDAYQTTGFYPFTIDSGNPYTHAQARQFPKRAGYHEDPATGVAACALGAYLVEHTVFGSKEGGWHNFQVEQGHAMGRPSVIRVAAKVAADKIIRTRLGGRTWVLGEEDIVLAAA
ncbi:MAG: PhzF family phenazine biosynthesis protein [Acidiferrobacterales bacterium]